MSDEMETMKEFRKLWEKHICTSPDADEVYKTFKKELEPAVKREICRAFNEMVGEGAGNTIYNARFIREYVRKRYSPAPQYCEGMREMLINGVVKRIENGRAVFLESDDGLGKMLYGKCPACPEGKNCIGGKE